MWRSVKATRGVLEGSETQHPIVLVRQHISQNTRAPRHYYITLVPKRISTFAGFVPHRTSRCDVSTYPCGDDPKGRVYQNGSRGYVPSAHGATVLAAILSRPRAARAPHCCGTPVASPGARILLRGEDTQSACHFCPGERAGAHIQRAKNWVRSF